MYTYQATASLCFVRWWMWIKHNLGLWFLSISLFKNLFVFVLLIEVKQIRKIVWRVISVLERNWRTLDSSHVWPGWSYLYTLQLFKLTQISILLWRKYYIGICLHKLTLRRSVRKSLPRSRMKPYLIWCGFFKCKFNIYTCFHVRKITYEFLATMSLFSWALIKSCSKVINPQPC